MTATGGEIRLYARVRAHRLGVNKLHPKLNFTLESEVNNNINFPDLTITKTDNRHTFNICRKHTSTVSVAQHFKSSHTIQTFSILLHDKQVPQNTSETY